MSGVIEQINIASEKRGATFSVEEITAITGNGLEGDRHCSPKRGAKGRDLTLIAVEALDALKDETGIDLSPQESRRQVLTRGIDLNALVGKEFYVGDILCEGTILCEPCGHLERMTSHMELREQLRNRGGLCARIITSGVIHVGDRVSEQAPESVGTTGAEFFSDAWAK